MTTKQLALYALFLLIGIAIGGKVTNLAYKPILVSQAVEIHQKEEDNKRLQKRFGLLKVEIEAHRQDMEQFIDKSSLISVLKQLGIIE
jgi:hypothetical protein